jgi:hypothetical protein
MRPHTPYNPLVCARLGAPRTYYNLAVQYWRLMQAPVDTADINVGMARNGGSISIASGRLVAIAPCAADSSLGRIDIQDSQSG